ncbi:MAG: hypothetical protein CMP20_01655 [Rickettsiales bacterium]|nr:hypothetical protein [Rickettsiales bacterium]
MLRSDDAIVVGNMKRHSSQMLVVEPATQANAKLETLPPPKPANTCREKKMEHVSPPTPKRSGFSWKALAVAFTLGLVVMAVLTVFLELTPTDRAVKRLSAVNVDMTSSYRASTEAFSRRFKVMEAKMDRLLGETHDQDLFTEPKVIPLFDASVMEVCGIENGLADICDPAGNWKWIPPLKDNEWVFCETEDNDHVPCNFKRQPTFVGRDEL